MPIRSFSLVAVLPLLLPLGACKSKPADAQADAGKSDEAGAKGPEVRPQPPKFEPKVSDLAILERESWMPASDQADTEAEAEDTAQAEDTSEGADDSTLEPLVLTFTNLCGVPVEYAFTPEVKSEIDPSKTHEIPAHTRREVEIPKGWFLRSALDDEWGGGVMTSSPNGHVWTGGPGCTSRGAADRPEDDPALLPQRWGRKPG